MICDYLKRLIARTEMAKFHKSNEGGKAMKHLNRTNVSFSEQVVIVSRNEMYRFLTQIFEIRTDYSFNELDTAASNYSVSITMTTQ